MQKEDTVQAVLIADVYDKTLQPFIASESTVSNFLYFIRLYILNDARVDNHKAITFIHRVSYH